jgi:hypothetical protein
VKKLIAGISLFGIAGFGFIASANGDWFGGDTTTKVYVSNENSAKVYTDATSNADTGGNDADAKANSIGGSSRAKGGTIVTGNADATTEVGVAVNTNETEVNLGCGCEGSDGDTTTKVKVHNSNWAKVKTSASSYADTGDNDADAKANSIGGSAKAKGGHILTGDAFALTGVGIVANTNWTTVNIP